MDRLVRAVLGDWASEYGAVGVAVRAITAEGLIGCKLQALVNNPDRARDLDDIRALLLAQRGRLDMECASTSRCSIARPCSISCLPKPMSTEADRRVQPFAGTIAPSTPREAGATWPTGSS